MEFADSATDAHTDGRVFDPITEHAESCFWDVQTAPYVRCWSLARKKLNDGIVQLYNQDPRTFHTLTFTSGMNAIAAIVDAYSRGAPEGSIILHGSEMYSDVWYSSNYICGKRLKTRFVDIQNDEAVLSRFRDHGDKLIVFILEVCTNASGQMFNFDLIPKLHELAPDCLIVVDNTWLSPLACNPFHFDVDIVVESTTKHISGCHAISGLATGRRHAMEPLSRWLAFFGIHVASSHCLAIEQQLSSISARHLHASALALEMAAWLEATPSLSNRVLHPLLTSHPCHFRATKILNPGYGPTVFLFHVSCSVDAARAALQSLQDQPAARHGRGGVLLAQTSYGAPSSRLDPWPTEGPSDEFDGDVKDWQPAGSDAGGASWAAAPSAWHEEARTEDEEGKGAPGTWLRLSVGFEAGAAALKGALQEVLAEMFAREQAGREGRAGEEGGGGSAGGQGLPGELFGGVVDEYLKPRRWRRANAGDEQGPGGVAAAAKDSEAATDVKDAAKTPVA